MSKTMNPLDPTERFRAQLLAAAPWVSIAKTALSHLPDGCAIPLGRIMASDYAGYHKGSDHICYAYLLVDEHPHDWNALRWSERQQSRAGNRRVSYKRLRQGTQSVDIEYWLDATRHLPGNLVVFAISKTALQTFKRLSPDPAVYGLRARWKPAQLEEAVRKALFAALMTDRFVPPGSNLDWYSDEDPSVSNEAAVADFTGMYMRLCGALSSTERGRLAFGTTEGDCSHLFREDLAAIPDIAAGMLQEVLPILQKSRRNLGRYHPIYFLPADELSHRDELLASWFWFCEGKLTKSALIIDVDAQGRGKLEQVMLGTV